VLTGGAVISEERGNMRLRVVCPRLYFGTAEKGNVDQEFKVIVCGGGKKEDIQQARVSLASSRCR